MNNEDVVKELKAFALASYEDGGDWIYETHDYKDYLAVFERNGFNLNKSKAALKRKWVTLTAYAGELK